MDETTDLPKLPPKPKLADKELLEAWIDDVSEFIFSSLLDDGFRPEEIIEIGETVCRLYETETYAYLKAVVAQRKQRALRPV